jgi:hypothetical protein
MDFLKEMKLAVVGVVAVVVLILSGWIVENLEADRILCVQSPISGKLTWHVTPGWKWQGFGKITKYWKLDTYEFKIPVRFNDGGHGTIIGSLNYEMPLGIQYLTALHTKYGSADAVQKQLIETVTNKCVYMTGPLMSSKESYAEKRTSLINYIEDQIANGVYKTTQKDVKVKDALTGQDKTATVVEIVRGSDGKYERTEEAVLASYGISTSNFAVIQLPYDDAVEGQIKQQQEINMKVQTAIASAKEAEQNAITVAKQGEANAAKAKWEQEVVKAKMVTEAEQKYEVSILERKAAEQNKIKLILEGEGEAAKRRLIMQADGALEKKLDAYVKVQSAWADAFKETKQKWVPEVIQGASGAAGNAAVSFMEMLGIRAAKDLALDVKQKQ